ncbi:hypothetical protein [Paraburkholderia tropica]|uniref:hypothetical protein n=1 Tax=Paraburkholderia tropica TaxID=92647 RepID=UPI003D26D844
MDFEAFLRKWQNDPSTSSQIERLVPIAAALREMPQCLGAVLVGSFAKQSADRLSDLDLVAFCAPGEGRALFEAIRQQVATSQALFTLDGAHDAESPFQKLIFDDMTSIEFHVIAPATQLVLEQPFVEIVNRDRYLESRSVSRLAASVGDASSAYGYGDRGLAWELLTCLKWLWRGDVAAAKRYLIALGKAIDASEASEARAKV